MFFITSKHKVYCSIFFKKIMTNNSISHNFFNMRISIHIVIGRPSFHHHKQSRGQVYYPCPLLKKVLVNERIGDAFPNGEGRIHGDRPAQSRPHDLMLRQTIVDVDDKIVKEKSTNETSKYLKELESRWDSYFSPQPAGTFAYSSKIGRASCRERG